MCLITSASLRGYEGFYTDLAGLGTHLNKGKHSVIPPELTHKLVLEEKAVTNLPHVASCLLENFKGEGGVNYHTMNSLIGRLVLRTKRYVTCYLHGNPFKLVPD